MAVSEKERTREYFIEPGLLEPASGKRIKLELNDLQLPSADVTITFPKASGTLLTGAEDGTVTIPTSGGGTTTFSLPEVEDNVFRIVDNGDPTKKIAFEASGITPATTRTITPPDYDISINNVSRPFADLVVISGSGYSFQVSYAIWRIGSMRMLWLGPGSGTSSGPGTLTTSVGWLVAADRPLDTTHAFIWVRNVGTSQLGLASVGTSGQITFYKDAAATVFDTGALTGIWGCCFSWVVDQNA